MRVKLLLIAVAIIVILGTATYIIYQKYQAAQSQLQVERAIENQNKYYLEEIIKQKSDSINALAGKVVNLNTQFDIKLKNIFAQYTSQTVALRLAFDSLRAQGQGIASSGADSAGSYYQVDFKGKQGIASYKGYTKYYGRREVDFYALSLEFDPVDVFSKLSLDSDGIWRIHTRTTSPGVKLQTDYKIDSLFYALYQESQLGEIAADTPDNSNHVMGLRLRAGVEGSFIQDSWYNQHTFNLETEFYYKYFYVMYKPIVKVVGVGILLDMDLTKVYNWITTIF